MRPVLLPLWLVAAACGAHYDLTGVDSEGDSTAVPAFTIDGLHPSYGSTAGEDPVTVSGGPFSGEVVVRFDGEEATVESVEPDTLQILTPSVEDAGLADVEVEVEGRVVTVSGAYTYFGDGTGLAGVVGDVSWYEYVGGYWADPTDAGSATLSFLTPADFEYWEHFTPTWDACVEDYAYGGDLSLYDLGEGSVATMEGAGESFTLEWVSGGGYLASVLQESPAPDTVFDLLDLAPAAALPSFTVEGIAHTSTAPAVTSPAIQGTALPSTGREIPLAWVAGGADVVLVTIGQSDGDGTYFRHIVSCATDDDGSLTIPPSVWSDWTAGEYLYFYVGRYLRPSAILPHDGSRSEVAAVLWTVGAAETR